MVEQLFAVSTDHYNEEILTFIRGVSGKHQRICYVTLNKTSSAIKELFKEKGITVDVHFVDAVTPKLFRTPRKTQVDFIDSIDDSSELAESIVNTVMVNKLKFVVFDSLSSLLINKSDKEVQTFMNYILSFLEELHAEIIVIVLEKDLEKPSVKQLEMRASTVTSKNYFKKLGNLWGRKLFRTNT